MAKGKQDEQQDTKKREPIETAQDIGLPLAGYTVVATLKNIEVDRATLLAIMQTFDFPGRLGSQLSSDYIPGLPEASTSLKRAVKHWMRELTQTPEGKKALGLEEDEKTMWRDIAKGTGDILAIALVVESADLAAWGLSYLTNLRVFYTKSTDTLLLTTERSAVDVQNLQRSAEDQVLLTSLKPHWQYYRTIYTASDLSRMIQRILDATNPTDLRKDGRVYFVPYAYLDVLVRLKDLMEVALPAAPGQQNESSLNAIPVIDRPSTRRQLSSLAYKSLMREIDNLQTDLQRFITQASTPKTNKDGSTKKDERGQIRYHKVKPKTVAERLEMYKNMRNKITLYSESIGMQQEGLVAELEKLQQTARSLIEVEVEVDGDEGDDGSGRDREVYDVHTPSSPIASSYSDETDDSAL